MYVAHSAPGGSFVQPVAIGSRLVRICLSCSASPPRSSGPVSGPSSCGEIEAELSAQRSRANLVHVWELDPGTLIYVTPAGCMAPWPKRRGKRQVVRKGRTQSSGGLSSGGKLVVRTSMDIYMRT